jgi:hypothetical protein
MSTLITDQLVEEGAPRVRFAARERRGVFLGLSWGQIATIGLVAALLLVTLFVDVNAIWVMIPIATIIFLLGVGTWHREPVLAILWQAVRYGVRSSAGQTQYRRDAWSAAAATTLPVDRSVAGMPVPTSRFLMPGALGDIQILQIPGAGAFAYNAKAKLASITFTLGSRAWALRDSGTQEAAYDGFVEWLSSLEHVPGLTEGTIRIRVDKASSNQLSDYMTAQHRKMIATAPGGTGLPVSAELLKQYAELIQAGQKRSMAFTNHLTLTFSTDALAAQIRDAGKGMLGLGRILTERAAAVVQAMQRARLENVSWLRADELESMLATACDPAAASTRRERQSVTAQISDLNPPIMGVDEQWDAVRVDQSWHQTFWVAEWPRTDVRTGFLEPLLYAGDATRVIALQIRPVPIHKALAEVTRAQNDMETAENLRMRMSARVTLTHIREAEELAVRERDLVDGYGDVRFRGFITVSADSKDALIRGRSEIEQASHEARVNLVSMFGQQAAGFATTTLPLPTEGN